MEMVVVYIFNRATDDRLKISYSYQGPTPRPGPHPMLRSLFQYTASQVPTPALEKINIRGLLVAYSQPVAIEMVLHSIAS